MTTWQWARETFEKQLALNLKELNNPPTHWRYFIDCVKGLEGKIDRIIDLGCGVGIYYKLCKDNFPSIEYIGIDYSPYAVTKAIHHWQYPSFLLMDYDMLAPEFFTSKDLLVANALCDVLENGDECLDYILSLNIKRVMLQRVKLTNKSSFYKKYRAYGEVDTVEYYHNIENFYNITLQYGYFSLIDKNNEKINDYNIFLIKNPFIENNNE